MSTFRQILRHHLNQTRAGLFGQFEHAFNFNTGSDQDAALKIGPQQSVTFSGFLDDGSDTPFSLKVTNELTGPSGEGFQCQTQDPQSGTIVVGADPQKGQATLEFDAGSGEPPAPPQTSTLSYATNTTDFTDKWEAIKLDWSTNPVIFTKNPPLANSLALELARSFAGNYFAIERGPGDVQPDPIFAASYDSNSLLRWRFTGTGLGREQGFSIQHDNLHNVAVIAAKAQSVLTRLVGIDDDLAAVSGDANAAILWQTNLGAGIGNAEVTDMKANNDGHVYVLLNRPIDDYDGATLGEPKNVLKVNTLTGDVEAAYNIGLGAAFGSASGKLAIGPSGEVVVATGTSTVAEDNGAAADIYKFDADLTLVARREVDWETKLGNRARGRPVAIDGDGNIYASHGIVSVLFGPPALRILKFVPDLSSELFDVTIGVSGDACTDMVVLNGELFLGGNGPGFFFAGPAIIHRVNLLGVEIDTFSPPFQNDLVSMNGLEGVNNFAASEGNKANLFTQESSQTPPGRIPCIAAVKYDAGNIVSVYFNSVEVEFKEEDFRGNHSAAGDFQIRASAPGWEYNTPL